MREFGSEHPAVILPDGYLTGLQKYGKTTWLRSGREGLLLVAKNIKKAHAPVILFPAYCCWSMSAPFEMADWSIIYYRLEKDLTVDIDYLKELLLKYNPDAVLTMNFYGSASTEEAVKTVKTICPSCICVEDFSHCTFSFDVIYNPQVDYYVSSIRKSIGVTDGSIVISKEAIDTTSVKEEETPFTTNRQAAQLVKCRYSQTHSSEEKQDFLSVLSDEEKRLDSFNDEVFRISSTGKMMVDSVNGEEIRIARSHNMNHALELLKGKIELIPGIEKSINGAPFSLPILVNDRQMVQKKLAQRGVYAPVLWPICDDARSVCKISAYVSEHMLSIPIDQRYDWDDIEEICNIVLECVNE